MNCGEFTDNEIREELAHLGYHDVPQDKLEDFKKDLIRLISTERSKSNSLNSSQTTEPERDDKDFQPSHFTNAGSVEEENFTNHGNQWIGSQFNEDWQYQGQKESQPRPQTAPDQRGRPRRGILTGGYSRYEPPPSTSRDMERNQSCHRDDVSESGSESHCMKRKTSRKTANGCRQIDESFTDSESGVFEIYEKIKKLAMRECECGKSKCKSGDVEPPYRIKGKNKNPSVIKKIDPPHNRNLVRMDMYERLKMYREVWKVHPPIGENERSSIRKATHARMLHQDEVKLKPKVFVPNLYVPPHEKKRLDVRWKVRQAFESYELPDHGYYHEV